MYAQFGNLWKLRRFLYGLVGFAKSSGWVAMLSIDLQAWNLLIFGVGDRVEVLQNASCIQNSKTPTRVFS
jgi:hypothetical protein